MVIVGSKRMVQYDDTAADESVRVFDRGMEFEDAGELRRVPAQLPQRRHRRPARGGRRAAQPRAAGLRARDPDGPRCHARTRSSASRSVVAIEAAQTSLRLAASPCCSDAARARRRLAACSTGGVSLRGARWDAPLRHVVMAWRSPRHCILAGRTDHDGPWPSVRIGPQAPGSVANRRSCTTTWRRCGGGHGRGRRSRSSRRAAEPMMDGGRGRVRAGADVRTSSGSRSRRGGALAAARDFLADEPVLVEPADALHRVCCTRTSRPSPTSPRRDGAATSGRASRRGRATVAGATRSADRAVSILLDKRARLTIRCPACASDGGQVCVQDIDGCLPVPRRPGSACWRATGACSRTLRTTSTAALRRASSRARCASTPTRAARGHAVRGPAIIGRVPALARQRRAVHVDRRQRAVDGCQIEHRSCSTARSAARRRAHRDERDRAGARISRTCAPTAMRLSVGDGAEVTLA